MRKGETYTNTGQWPGAMITRETAQNFIQDKAPITLQEWHTRYRNTPDAIGNYWVIDHETGWAYWANQLNGGQATSYLIDAAHMRPEADEINGSYYYGIHVSSELIRPDREFQDEPTAGAVSELIAEIRDYGDGNPISSIDYPISAFNFSRMRPRRLFTTSGQQFRYLENQDEGNHMIIRNEAIALGINGSEANQRAELDRWYTQEFLPDDPELRAQWEEHVAPVASDFDVGNLPMAHSMDADGLMTTLPNFSVPYADRTVVVPDGEKRAFSLSVADVNHLTRIGSFSSMADRGTNIGWWLRTPTQSVMHTWNVPANGWFSYTIHMAPVLGIRPALIIHQ
ncbi:hypothetical protein [Lactococcus petauri]|uniref:hypothetical protein n=1 Tax=Lactococcus petauri TaxID=1940789 RepID=UPI0032673756